MAQQTDEKDIPGRSLTYVGMAVTLAYILLIVGFSCASLHSFAVMKPQDWGSFLGGIFAPLAFLWLILGFLQQGYELRHSSRALWLQGEELRNSVEQQRALVETAREQIDFEKSQTTAEREDRDRRRKPVLRAIANGGSTGGSFIQRNIRVENFGASCTNIVLEVIRDKKSIGSDRCIELPKGGYINTQFSCEREFDITSLEIRCSYVDSENYHDQIDFNIVNDAKGDEDFFNFRVVPIASD